MIKRIIFIFIILMFFSFPIYSTNEILSSQMESLNISSLIKEGENYTKEVFPDIDLENFFSSSLRGEVNNQSILTSILYLIGSEIVPAITILRKCFNNNCYT